MEWRMDRSELTSGCRLEDVIGRHYDEVLARHGDTAQGAHWPNETKRRLRFDVMLDLMGTHYGEPGVLCDFGCGTGELLAHLRRRGLDRLEYVGVDRSALALSYARQKFPAARFVEIDVTAPDAPVDALACDWLVCNGVFTVKWEVDEEQMWRFLGDALRCLWPRVRRGLAFNVMSKAVDWERDDLFHASKDRMAGLLHGIAGRRIAFRADYGLYEYTAYLYR
jgi:SAM-dependent methyltransferase